MNLTKAFFRWCDLVCRNFTARSSLSVFVADSPSPTGFLAWRGHQFDFYLNHEPTVGNPNKISKKNGE